MGKSDNKLYVAPPSLNSDDEIQQQRFHSFVTGPWMGSGPWRGFPYTLDSHHVGDADGKVSPRLFITGLRVAAEDTWDRPCGHEYAQHYNSIKRGVRAASKIRVRAIGKDYPWVDRLLNPLAGATIPCQFEAIRKIWKSKKMLKQLSNQLDQDEVRLLPRNLEQGQSAFERISNPWACPGRPGRYSGYVPDRIPPRSEKRREFCEMSQWKKN